MTPTSSQDLAAAFLAAKDQGIDVDTLLFQLAKGDYPTMQRFLSDPAWLGVDNIWPALKALLIHIRQPGIHKYHLEIGKGGGKSTLSAVDQLYSAGELIALEDAHSFFQLDPGKPITCITVATSETQAKLTIFAKIKSLVERIPFFANRQHEVLTDRIVFERSSRFPEGRIMMLCGHSKAESLEGHDVYHAILDEANKHRDSSGKSNAKTLFEMLVSSAKTRFPAHFRVGTISSSLSHQAFQRQRVDEILRVGTPLVWEDPTRCP